MTKITRLEADKAMLQEQIKNLLTQNQRNHEDVEELEQYGRRLCLRIDGVPTEEKETSKDLLQKIMSLCSDAEIDIPDMAYDPAHRIGKAYNDKGTTLRAQIFAVRNFRGIYFRDQIAKLNSVKFSKFQSIAKICSAKLKKIVLLFFVNFCSIWPISTNTMFKIGTIRYNHVNLSERQLL